MHTLGSACAARLHVIKHNRRTVRSYHQLRIIYLSANTAHLLRSHVIRHQESVRVPCFLLSLCAELSDRSRAVSRDARSTPACVEACLLLRRIRLARMQLARLTHLHSNLSVSYFTR